MGLDNGVIIRNFEELDDTTKKEVRAFCDNRGEVAYWRKCWNIRRVFIQVLHMGSEEYQHTVEADDIPAIIRHLKPFFNKDNWDESETIWEFDDYWEYNLNQVFRLMKLQDYMEHYPGRLEVYFYDSY